MSDFNINAINSIMSHFEVKRDVSKDIESGYYHDDDGYDYDEGGNMISCCGDVLDPDNMICPTCKEHN